METKHYKAPWRAEGWQGIVVNDADGNTLAVCPGNIRQDGLEVIKANARLLAAAPTLLAACKAALEYLEANPDEYSDHRAELCRNAIAAAEGREVTT